MPMNQDSILCWIAFRVAGKKRTFRRVSRKSALEEILYLTGQLAEQIICCGGKEIGKNDSLFHGLSACARRSEAP
jgi:hypothetical protein